MKTSTFSLLIALSVSIVLLPSCKKDCDEPTKTALSLNFYPMVGNSALVYNQEYVVNGRKLKFTKAQFYVSSISLKNTDNTTVDPEMRYALVQGLETVYSTGKIDAGNYNTLEFSIGVDSAANHGDPTQWSATHPLYAAGIYSSYWDWTQGYVFMKLEGYVDTTTAANGNATTGFSYHLGNDNMLRNISLSIDKSIDGSETSIELNVDYAKLLEDIDLKTEIQTHSSGTDSIAEKIADKAQEAFTIK